MALMVAWIPGPPPSWLHCAVCSRDGRAPGLAVDPTTKEFDADELAAAYRAHNAEAEAWLKAALDERPFALSLEVMEIDARFAEKRFNTLHAHLAHQGSTSPS